MVRESPVKVTPPPVWLVVSLLVMVLLVIVRLPLSALTPAAPPGAHALATVLSVITLLVMVRLVVVGLKPPKKSMPAPRCAKVTAKSQALLFRPKRIVTSLKVALALVVPSWFTENTLSMPSALLVPASIMVAAAPAPLIVTVSVMSRSPAAAASSAFPRMVRV